MKKGPNFWPNYSIRTRLSTGELRVCQANDFMEEIVHRLFVAIDFPDEIKESLTRLCHDLSGAKWVPAEQVHLTLRFIGEVEDEMFINIRQGLSSIQAPPMTISLKGLGCFPPRKNPRVLWAGLEENDSLVRLQNKVESTLVALGLEPERRQFTPHVTLARLRDLPPGRLANYLAKHALFAVPPFRATDFHLYSSKLTSNGAFHAQEASYQLE